jgi:hypothetical protein
MLLLWFVWGQGGGAHVVSLGSLCEHGMGPAAQVPCSVCVCVFACEGPEVHSTHRVVSFHQAGNMGRL